MAEKWKEANNDAASEFTSTRLACGTTISQICVSDADGNFVVIRGPFFEVKEKGGKEAFLSRWCLNSSSGILFQTIQK